MEILAQKQFEEQLEKQFEEKIMVLDKKLEDLESRVQSVREERNALVLARKSFLGKEKITNQKKDSEIGTIISILRANGSIHYSKIAEQFNAACGTAKSAGAINTMLYRLVKNNEAGIEKDPTLKGNFKLYEEDQTQEEESPEPEDTGVNIEDLPF